MMKKLFSFVSGLSGREKVLFYGAAAAVFLVMFKLIILGRILSDIDMLDKRIRSREESIEYALAVIDLKDMITREKKALAAFLEPPESPEEEIPEIQELIQNLANNASVITREIRPMDPKDESESRRYRVRVTCEAGLTKLLEFIYAIEDSEKMFEVETLRIVPKPESAGVVIGTMEVVRMVVL